MSYLAVLLKFSRQILESFCQVSKTNPVWILVLNIYISLGQITIFAECLPVTDKIHNFKQTIN